MKTPYQVLKTLSRTPEEHPPERERERNEAGQGPMTQTHGSENKQLRGIASGVRSLFLVGSHGKQTVLIKSPLLVRT